MVSVNMGSGAWQKPRETSNLREVEQLRVLVMYEFDPPLSSQELASALRACGNRTQDAYNYLKANRRHLNSAVSIPSSAPAMVYRSPEREHEKRRNTQSSEDENDTPNKKRRDLSYDLLIDTEEKDVTPDTQRDAQGSSAADCARAQQLLFQTVEDRIAARQPLRNSDWVNDVWSSLQVPVVLEMAMQLNLTVDALAKWVKQLESDKRQEVLTRGAALTVEVVANLPPIESSTASVADNPKDEELLQYDENVATKIKALQDAGELSAFARANAAKNAIECLSTACAAYMTWLSWAACADNRKSDEAAAVEKSFETLNQKLAALIEQRSQAVKENEQTLFDARQLKSARSQQIVDFANTRHQELVAQGDSEASARVQSLMETWNGEDLEAQALWKSRKESEARVEMSARDLTTANYALTFNQNLMILFRKVRDRRERALKISSKCFEDIRTASDARATTALEMYIPMLTSALFRYFEFHSIQQAKAKEEQLEQEKALEAHNEYFGDTAPIKRNDIEQRIREFIGVTHSSMQVIMEIADGQRKLWEDKELTLPESVRHALVREFKTLWLQLSGPMRDVMSKFVSTIEEAAGARVAVDSQCELVLAPAAVNFSDEHVIPVFTVPALTISEAVTPYRAAISAVVAPNENKSNVSSVDAGKAPTAQSVITPVTNERVNIASIAETPPQVSEARPEFELQSVVYSKVAVGEGCTQFVRGVVVKQLENGMYFVKYDNGDKFSVRSSFLLTKDLMEQHVKAGGPVAPPDQDMEGAKSSSGCGIM
ncbi:hypothetical protein BBJ29_000410 [Phytophthora kernoviae]|uniref:Uncharacterized protein n=1 Tax=Phytophthora kernoviae TaxID=325452 RepID=A0A3F2RZI5_9STRA|nr:hypothetical protein BBJ29_000410 [Phytophthora kernoviae]RLN67321.1 hypothetical protein BBP00_00001690 [Phytophthora kernoviae]